MSKRLGLRKLAFGAAVFVVVWIIAFFYWRATNRIPSGQDIALVGLGLPLLLIVGFAGFRGGIDWLRRPKATPATAPAADAAVDGAGANESLTWTLGLLDSSLVLPAGTEAADVIAVALARDNIGLHADLRRSDGTLAMAVGVSTLAPDLFDAHPLPGETPNHLDEEQQRALLLAIDALQPLLARHPAEPAPAAGGGTPAASASRPFPLHWILPERWREASAAMVAWLSQRLAEIEGLPGVAAPHLTFVAHPAQALAVVDALQTLLRQDETDVSHIVLACDSWLSEPTVAAWERSGQLHTSRQQNGRIPGEGACALLLAQADAPNAEPVPRLHRLVAGQRAASLDHPNEIWDETVPQLLERARVQTIAPELAMDACALVSDADQRATRNAEMVGIAYLAWPKVPNRDPLYLPLGLANGESGGALALSAVAVAAAHSLNEGKPTFAVTLSDPLARAVLLVSPPKPASTEVPTGETPAA